MNRQLSSLPGLQLVFFSLTYQWEILHIKAPQYLQCDIKFLNHCLPGRRDRRATHLCLRSRLILSDNQGCHQVSDGLVHFARNDPPVSSDVQGLYKVNTNPKQRELTAVSHLQAFFNRGC